MTEAVDSVTGFHCSNNKYLEVSLTCTFLFVTVVVFHDRSKFKIEGPSSLANTYSTTGVKCKPSAAEGNCSHKKS